MRSIRPIIVLRPDGTLGMKAKTRDSRGNALQTLLHDFQEVHSTTAGSVISSRCEAGTNGVLYLTQ